MLDAPIPEHDIVSEKTHIGLCVVGSQVKRIK